MEKKILEVYTIVFLIIGHWGLSHPNCVKGGIYYTWWLHFCPDKGNLMSFFSLSFILVQELRILLFFLKKIINIHLRQTHLQKHFADTLHHTEALGLIDVNQIEIF